VLDLCCGLFIIVCMELHRERIIIELERNGWTQADLCRRMKVKRQWFNRIMVGKRGISLGGVEKIANALGLSGKEILK